MTYAALVLWLAGLPYADEGRLSVYHPGDGWNRGTLACGGRFTWQQEHIAYRGWWRVGCGRKVVVCTDATRRCALSAVQDAGPFGIYRGALRHCRAQGRWKVWTKRQAPPAGWRFRGVADLSWALWIRLGRPSFLSKVRLYFVPTGPPGDAVVAFLRDVLKGPRPVPLS